MDVPSDRKTEHTSRIIFIIVLILGVFGILVWRLYDLQVVQHEELLAKAKKRYITSVKVHALRGSIRDVRGQILASDEPYYSLTVSPANFPPMEKTCSHKNFADPYRCVDCVRDPVTIRRAARFFSDQLGLNYPTLVAQFSRTTRSSRVSVMRDGVAHIEEKKRLNQYEIVLREIDYEEGKKLMERMSEFIKLNREKVPKEQRSKEDFSKAFNLEVRYRRTYPLGRLLANVIGYVNIDAEKAIGQSGLEKSANESLKPSEGKRTYERTLRGTVIAAQDGVDEREAAVPGNDIFLTINQPIQAIIENELDNLVYKWKPKLAYCIVVDPKTGDILALAQRPTFNPNNRATFSGRNIQNLMAENIYEPGSTMKPIPVAMAIDEGLVTENSLFNCENGYWVYGGKPLRDCHPYGMLTTQQIIQKSSNVGTAKITLLLGNKRLDEGYRRFGFGQKTNIPVRPESRGLYLPLRRWSMLTPTRIAIGQGIAVTPFQMIRAYSAICNNGLLPQLRLIDRITEYDGAGKSFTHRYETAAPQQMFKHPETTCKAITQMMRSVCEQGGTARSAAVPGYYTAGKTGTAQKVINGVYSNTKHVGNFVGFVPAEDPKIVLLVAVDEPQGSSYGGVVAAPLFATAGERIMKYLQVNPDYKLGSDEDPDPKRRDLFAKLRREGKINDNEPEEIHLADVLIPIPVSEGEDPDAIFAPEEKLKPLDVQFGATLDEADLRYMREVGIATREAMTDSARNQGE